MSESDRTFSANRRESGPTRRRARGFAPADIAASGLLRGVAGRRGIAENRLLTHWAEIVGSSLAEISRPLRIRYDRGGFALGGVLILAADRAAASQIEHQKALIIERVNAHYGYAAIRDVRLTQIAAPRLPENDRPARARAISPHELDAPRRARLDAAMRDVDDPELRAALTRLGANVIGRAKNRDERAQDD